MNYITHGAKQWCLCKRQNYNNWTYRRPNIIKLITRGNAWYIYWVLRIYTIWNHINIKNSSIIFNSSWIGYLSNYFILIVKYIAHINYSRSLKFFVINWYPCIIKTIILVENFHSKVNTTWIAKSGVCWPLREINRISDISELNLKVSVYRRCDLNNFRWWLTWTLITCHCLLNK